MATILRSMTITCDDCGFTTSDTSLAQGHDCSIQENGGRCEDFPCCGHELGDCNGLLYGSDDAIKEAVYARMSDDDYDPYYDESDR